MLDELQEVLSILIKKVNFLEKEINLCYAFPLRLHSRYNRNFVIKLLLCN